MGNRFDTVSIDEIREYWNRRPCNIRHSPRPLGTREYFDEVEARKYLVEPHIPAFAEFARWNGKKVLEIGCGLGTDTINFARNGAQVTAIELSEKSLEVARQRAAVFGLQDRITFYHGNAEELSQIVPVELYDLVYSFGVIHHTPHPERVIAQVRQYMGVNSVLKIMMYHRWSWKVLWIVLGYGRGQIWKLNSLVARHSEAQTGCPVTYIYSRNELRELLHAYPHVKMHVDHIFPYHIPDYVQYRYKKVWYYRWMPHALFRRLEQRFGWHLMATARLG